MCTCRFLTGVRGVAVRLLRLLRRSRSEDEETVRVADVNTKFRTCIVAGGARHFSARIRFSLLVITLALYHILTPGARARLGATFERLRRPSNLR